MLCIHECETTHLVKRPVLVNTLLLFPPHEPAGKRKQKRVNRTPANQNAKVNTDTRMQVEEDGTATFDDYKFMLVTSSAAGMRVFT